MGTRYYIDDNWDFTEHFTTELTRDEYEGELCRVRLPHTCKETPFNYFDESLYQMVSGYRREFPTAPEWKGKRVFVTFDGVGHVCRVFLNGEQIGEHRCGYTAFSIELTGKLRTEGQNVLTVEVDSRESLNVPPFGFVSDYMTFGGIYRDVYLEIYEESFLQDVFVSTTQGTKYRVKTEITVDAGKAESGEYQIRQFLRRKGAEEYVLLGSVPLGESKKESTDFDAEKAGKIELWDLEHPALYQLKTQLLQGEKILDEREDIFGFRTMRFKKDGFYLNGKKVKIRGLNRHQSYPYIGYAATKSLQVNDADLLKKELGVNAVRTSHYPQSHYFLDRCDELGMLVFTELPGWQHIGDDQWKDQAVKNTEEMVLQYRNHPSIMIWGVRINESPDDDAFYQRTNSVAHRLDPTRQTGGVRALRRSHLFEDVYTYNDFVHEGNNRGCLPKRNVTSDMEKAYLITEYNGHMYPTKSYDCEDKRVEHALRHANVLNDVGANPDIAGCFGWCMFDYNTHKDFGSGDRICYHGVMDMFRNPKLAAAVYASQQDQVPVLVPSSSMDIGEHPGCRRGQIYLFTNADSVKMYKNGVMIREYKKQETAYKNIPHGPLLVDDFVGDLLETEEHMEKGQAENAKDLLNKVATVGLNRLPLETKMRAAKLVLIDHMNYTKAARLYNKYIGDWGGTSTDYRFEAVKNGKTVMTVDKKPMKSKKLVCMVDHTDLKEDQTYDMAAVRIQMQDESGNVLSFDNEPLQFSVEGDIHLVGPAVVSLQGGMSGTYVKTAGREGRGVLRVTAQNCEPVEIRFDVKISENQ
ncbi:MAG: glycoside hydrolase family 2 protein [Lachnospiraceae bacterium]|nr:glycoside hydrolase family 2 protein [Lachnospiraceae bacterium]